MVHFLHIAELDGMGGMRELSQHEVPDNVSHTGNLWVHLDCNIKSGEHWLSSLEGVPSAVVEALFAEETRPRVERIGQGLLLTLRGVNLNPNSSPTDMVSLRIWFTPNLIVTTRRRRLLSVQDIFSEFKKGTGPISTSDLLTQLTKALTIRMAGTIDTLEDLLSDLEEDMGQGIQLSQRALLVEKRLETVRLRRFLAPQKEAINKLSLDHSELLSETQVIEIRESVNDLTRYLESLESLRERSLFMQEEFVNLQAERMNARMYVLSLLSGIFLPLSFLTGLFGINIGGMPGVDNGMSFWYFCISLSVLGGIQYWLMKKSRWF
ncbi:zinc transporter ZntB [Marinomonas sp. 15G1-11]|uniref:Zinc transporter ZntB n=1 Tax=Marinomonas phaeophyticola TaxID=3004091 RepID=A0ABT4JSS6_9GAMM|nr:zinc transporter ZntB [Marinomonas sp. 15G1-11]MCZ2721256.1 zinc transporter ZntB [Marinomonas sp. 15G1-11]